MCDAMTPKSNIDETHLLNLFRQMLAIRRLEEASAKAYLQGKIGGFLHLCIGQEAVCVGAIAALKQTDYVIATYRDHGHAYAKGASAKSIMAELYGKKTGIVKGLGGSMHFFDRSNNFLGGHGIVGGHIPLAAGIAFRAKYKKTSDVTLCFYGDGASVIGGTQEGFDLIGLWKLPVVLICENNQYAMGTALERFLPVPDIASRAIPHGIQSECIDGHDVLAVQDSVAKAVQFVRENQQPKLIEVNTYRYRGHSMSDPGKYRTTEEVESHKQKDPVKLAKQHLLNNNVNEDQIKAIEEDVKEEIKDAVIFAEQSPPADDYASYTYKD